jgi:hypothetical protein
MIDKYESRRIRAEVRRVLLDVWDPIGIKDEPTLRTSTTAVWVLYFTYSRLARRMTRSRNTCGEGTEHIGLQLQKEAMYPTVAALRQIALPEDSS